MFKTLTRQAIGLIVGATLAHAATVHAQGVAVPVGIQVTVVGADASCSGFTSTGPANAPTLTCIPLSGPAPFSCNLTGAPVTIAPGAAVNLAMNCSGGTAPYTYSWTGEA